MIRLSAGISIHVHGVFLHTSFVSCTVCSVPPHRCAISSKHGAEISERARSVYCAGRLQYTAALAVHARDRRRPRLHLALHTLTLTECRVLTFNHKNVSIIGRQVLGAECHSADGEEALLGTLHIAASNEGLAFHLGRPRAFNRTLSQLLRVTGLRPADIEITADKSRQTSIRLIHGSTAITHSDICGLINRPRDFIRLGAIGGEEGSYCYGGHHGYRYGGGGQGAGTRKRATGCRSRSCIVSWCVAGTITPLPHLVPYPQSVHPSEPLNSRVDILCIMPLSLLFYV